MALRATSTNDAAGIPAWLGPRTRGRLALLAGLDGAALKGASRWLATSGFEVVVAADVPGALDIIAERSPDVVLADMALRDGRGRSLCEALRSGRTPPTCPCWPLRGPA
jgi:CheY-like chemotaxis protein